MQPESAGPWELPHGLREDKGAQGAELSIWGSKECACAGQTFRKWEQVGDPVVEVMGVFMECGLCWTEHFDTHTWSWTPSLVASLPLSLQRSSWFTGSSQEHSQLDCQSGSHPTAQREYLEYRNAHHPVRRKLYPWQQPSSRWGLWLMPAEKSRNRGNRWCVLQTP